VREVATKGGFYSRFAGSRAIAHWATSGDAIMSCVLFGFAYEIVDVAHDYIAPIQSIRLALKMDWKGRTHRSLDG